MSEFNHYDGCRFKDPNNCSGCALTQGGINGPNYAGWPLVYIEANRSIPALWREALEHELSRTDNPAYVANLKLHIKEHGVRFTDGNGLDEKTLGEL